MPKLLLVLCLLVQSQTLFAQQKEVRVALVIGNSAYKQAPLRNPVNDARDMAVRLRSLGFTVIERSNLGIRQIGSTLREFRSKLTPGSVALVFYAGHGMQIKGENYLPARSFRSSSRGLSKENAPSGTLISFATRPGSVASDGVGRNGLYTGALLTAMTALNRPIEQVLKAVVTAVRAGSKNQQDPWTEGSIEGEFCFGGCLAPSTDIVSNAATSSGTSPSPSPEKQDAVPPTGVSEQSTASFKDCDECPEMLPIPAGTFSMGSKADPFASQPPPPDEQPQHTVSVRGFNIGKYEITQEQWFSVMGVNPSKYKGRSLPVEQVSWEDAQVFVKKLSEKTGKRYRLPTEAEWEYAARAGSQALYSFGDDVQQLGQYAWFTGNAMNVTHPVGEKRPNAFGLHDVHGNVWEWTEDCWHDDYKGAPADGSAWGKKECSRWVLRGGSFVVYPQNLRSAFRGYLSIVMRIDYMVGLRVARDD